MPKKIAGALAAVALTVLAAVACWVWMRPAPNPSIDEGRAVADVFLRGLRGGKPSDVWATTTSEFKNAEGRERFSARLKKNAWLSEPMVFSSAQQVNVNGTERIEFVFTSEKSGKPVRLLVGRDQRQWRVDRLSF